MNKVKVLQPGTFEGLDNLVDLVLLENKLTTIQPGTFKGLVNLKEINLSKNNLTTLQQGTFEGLINLHILDLSDNKLTAIQPGTFEGCINLKELYLSNNKLKAIQPGIFEGLINLDNLDLSENNLTAIQQGTFEGCVNLIFLDLSENDLTVIEPGNFEGCVNLRTLNLSYNNLTSLPIEVVTLRNLDEFYYDDNPVIIDPIIERFLQQIENITGTLYSNGQNVHSHSIQESVRKSIINILKDETRESAFLKEVLEDDVLTATTKSLLTEYLEDTTSHSTLFVTFEDLFKRVWNRIKTHRESTELKQILNQEMKESECKCFTGRLSRLINVLSGGFFDDVNITIQSSEQIAYVIAAVKERLEKEGNYTVEKHREIAVKELTERGYESDVIKVWTDEI